MTGERGDHEYLDFYDSSQAGLPVSQGRAIVEIFFLFFFHLFCLFTG
jgi:hypothetical protein